MLIEAQGVALDLLGGRFARAFVEESAAFRPVGPWFGVPVEDGSSEPVRPAEAERLCRAALAGEGVEREELAVGEAGGAPSAARALRAVAVPVRPTAGARAVLVVLSDAHVSSGNAGASRAAAHDEALLQIAAHVARVAEREAAARAAREQASLSLLESAHEGVFRYDASRRVIYANRRVAELLGRPLGEVIGSDATGLTHVSDLKARERIELRSEGASQYEVRLATPEGREVWVLASAAPIFDAEGRYDGGLVFVSDISARRSAELDVRDQNAELERCVAERTADLEQVNRELEAFAYSVSHDLRAPLRAVMGFGRILQEEHAEGLDGEAREYLDLITSNAARMGELIDDLLELSRVGRASLRLELVDDRELVAEVWGELAQAREGRDVKLQVGALPPCRADRRLLRLVWLNLLSNAVKFTRTRERAVVEVQAERARGEVRFHVQDNGVGFDMRHASQLFEVFQRLHRQDEFEGTGVGLAIVQRIVSRHGGRVWAEAQPGAGARVSFALREDGGEVERD